MGELNREKEKAFLRELRELLKKYDAEINAKDFYDEFRDNRITIDIGLNFECLEFECCCDVESINRELGE